MTTFLLLALAVALVAAVLALARERRLRAALEKLLHLILSRWRAHFHTQKPKTWTLWIVLSILTSGCDERAAQIAREAADRQAQQNAAMVELNKEVAGGTRRLVEADAQARKEIVGVHRDLQAERSQLNTGWNALEEERRQIASQRRTESLLVPAIQAAGLLALVALVLGFSWYALVRSQDTSTSASEVNDLLIGEIISEDPQLLTLHDERLALTGPSQADDRPVD
jgi:hypothetical protein